jgi:chromate transporter
MLGRGADRQNVNSRTEVFVRFLRLGCTSFGGPIAHLGYFRREFVDRSKWLEDAAFAEIVALCSVLPGPTSSQVGILLGARRAGPVGGLLAWLGFTTPSALLLAAFGLFLDRAAAGADPVSNTAAFGGALEGLAAAAAAVVAIAVVQLGRTLLRNRLDAGIAGLAFLLALGLDRFAPAFQWLALVAGGLIGGRFAKPAVALPKGAPVLAISRNVAFGAGAAFVVLLAGLPIVAPQHGYLATFATFFRAGALVFGGGHVVLPFLQSLIGNGVSERTFFAGYGAAQAVPGPLFTFASFLGAVLQPFGGAVGALVALVGIFLPSFLLLAAVVPLWAALRELPRSTQVLAGLNAAVVGLLAAVFVDPIATTLFRDPVGIAIAIVALALLAWARLPAWAVVCFCALGGVLIRSYAFAHTL